MPNDYGKKEVADMGGLGSGNRFQRGKGTTRDKRALDVRWLHREGFLTPERYSNVNWLRNGKVIDSIGVRAECGRIDLFCNVREVDGEWGYEVFPVSLNWTSCHFGGQRPWFLCPSCGRCVAILYGGATFACRRCHDLAYASQREDEFYRILRRARKIRARLGWKGTFGPKPKAMHWQTFERLIQAHDDCHRLAMLATAQKFNL